MEATRALVSDFLYTMAEETREPELQRWKDVRPYVDEVAAALR